MGQRFREDCRADELEVLDGPANLSFFAEAIYVSAASKVAIEALVRIVEGGEDALDLARAALADIRGWRA